MKIRTIPAAGAAALLLGLTACGGSGGTASSDSMSETPAAAMSEKSDGGVSEKSAAGKSNAAVDDMSVPGSYIGYGDYLAKQGKYATGDVVLFFNASWCPTCQEAQGNLESAVVPEGLTIVSVDYDTNTDLREQYGVTTQHTFVQVDPDGAELKKFTGATSVDDITGQLA